MGCTKCKRKYHPDVTDCRVAMKEKRDVTQRNIEATSKPCPKCSTRVSHWHGHDCHHISPATRGCPTCHTHWCYSCGTAGPRGSGYCNSSPRCRVSCISDTTITQHLLT